MSNEKFTPGKWKSRPGNTTVLDKKGNPIAMVYRADYYRTKEEAFANTALIETAPDMYRMLQYLADGIRWGGVQHTDRSLAAEIENLLKKARGEQ